MKWSLGPIEAIYTIIDHPEMLIRGNPRQSSARARPRCPEPRATVPLADAGGRGRERGSVPRSGVVLKTGRDTGGHRGRRHTHTVLACEDGFGYEGQVIGASAPGVRQLSAVARIDARPPDLLLSALLQRILFSLLDPDHPESGLTTPTFGHLKAALNRLNPRCRNQQRHQTS